MSKLQTVSDSLVKMALNYGMTPSDAGGGYMPTLDNYTPYDTSSVSRVKMEANRGNTDLQRNKFNAENLENTIDGAMLMIPGAGVVGPVGKAISKGGKYAIGAYDWLGRRAGHAIRSIPGYHSSFGRWMRKYPLSSSLHGILTGIIPRALHKHNHIAAAHAVRDIGNTARHVGNIGTLLVLNNALGNVGARGNAREAVLLDVYKNTDNNRSFYGNPNIPATERTVAFVNDVRGALNHKPLGGDMTNGALGSLALWVKGGKTPYTILLPYLLGEGVNKLQSDYNPEVGANSVMLNVKNIGDSNGYDVLAPSQATKNHLMNALLRQVTGNGSADLNNRVLYSQMDDVIRNVYNKDSFSGLLRFIKDTGIDAISNNPWDGSGHNIFNKDNLDATKGIFKDVMQNIRLRNNK